MLFFIYLFLCLTTQDRHNITDDFNSSQGGYSVGNGCESGEFSYWVYDGDIDLAVQTLELNFGELKIIGLLLIDGVEVTVSEALTSGLLKFLCATPDNDNNFDRIIFE